MCSRLSDIVVKGNPVRNQVKDFMFAGLPAAERTLIDSSKSDYTPQEWDTLKHLKSQATKDLGGLVSKFKKAMERREALENPQPEEAEDATEEVTEEVTEEATEEQLMIHVVENYIAKRKEDEDWPNAVEITKTSKAFIKALSK